MTARLEIDEATVTYRQPGRRTSHGRRRRQPVARDGRGARPRGGVGLRQVDARARGVRPRAARVRRDPLRRRAGDDSSGSRPRESRQRRIQMVFQNPYASLNPRRRMGAQIEDARRVAGRDALPVEQLLEQVGLEPAVARRYPYEFSGGQRQRDRHRARHGGRAGGADRRRAHRLARREPPGADRVADARRRASQQGASLLFISHDLSVVRVIADRIAVMQAGRIVEEGPTDRCGPTRSTRTRGGCSPRSRSPTDWAASRADAASASSSSARTTARP